MYTYFDSVSCRLSVKTKSLGGVALVAADLALLSFMTCDLICCVADVLSLYKKEKKATTTTKKADETVSDDVIL